MNHTKTIIEMDTVIEELDKKKLIKFISKLLYVSDEKIVVYDEEEYTEKSSFATEVYQRIKDELINDIISNNN